MMRKVCIIGSGNWGSTIAKIVGNNVMKLNDYCKQIPVWVHEEQVNGVNLTEIINKEHENVKYLPGIKLPENVIAVPNISSVTESADVIIIVMPHQFLNRTLEAMKPHVKPTAYAVSLMKGLALSENNRIRLLSDEIRERLSIPCAIIMGANLAVEVSRENYCESTVAVNDAAMGAELKTLFQTDYFRISVIKDEVGAELCGALKNIVAVAAGIVEGLGYGDNTKAAIIRLGFMEMKNFIYKFFSERNPDERTFLESCGVADMITTCYGGRNKQMGVALSKSNQPLADLERDLLKGQSAQGPITAAEVYTMLETNKLLDDYPIFTAVHRVCTRQLPADQLICSLANHPQHR